MEADDSDNVITVFYVRSIALKPSMINSVHEFLKTIVLWHQGASLLCYKITFRTFNILDENFVSVS
jgi:hypothetical protein